MHLFAATTAGQAAKPGKVAGVVEGAATRPAARMSVAGSPTH
jgi:hypothetical protein